MTLPVGTTHAFAALCGATVVVIAHPERNPECNRTWLCRGCDRSTVVPQTLDAARTAANAHAAACRALPKPEGS